MEVQSKKPSSLPTGQQVASMASSQEPSPLPKLVLVASIAAGIQFGWALQLSLLTPYVQLLGIPHKWASYIWLCGPISGMLVQPIVGFHSDNCTSRFGRRRPFIIAGACSVAVAVFLIGYAADIGHKAGDSLEKTSKPRAIAVFVVGFWILDVANNMLQGPCRALLADLSANNAKKTRVANAAFSFFMAIGCILGYAAGSYKHLYKIFPFTRTKACDVYCANLKSCFFISIALLATVTIIAMIFVKERQWSPDEKVDKAEDEQGGGSCRMPFFGEILGALKETKKPMWILLLATFLNWIAWFPFLLFDTDWMGREVFGGKVGGDSTSAELNLYNMGVRAGALGLMLNSVVLGVMSLGVESVGRWVGGVKRLWGIVNILLAICMAMTVVVSKLAASSRHHDGGEMLMAPPGGIKAGALALFAVLGVPLAITYSVPFAMASIFCSNAGADAGAGAGQGLSLAVLNLSIVIPQMIVSVLSGKWDEMFGGGNLPAFVVGAIAAAASAVVALFLLPSPPPDAKTGPVMAFH